MIIGGYGSGKTNALLNLISQQDDIDKIYLYAKDLSEPRYEFLIKKLEDAGTKHFNDSNAFIECSNTMDDVYENIDDCNPSRKRKILIVFDDMIADIMTNKKFQAIIKELFIRCRKLNISLVFITQSYFSVPKDFVKIYRDCKKEPCSFLSIDTTLPASNPLRFRKNLFHSYKK